MLAYSPESGLGRVLRSLHGPAREAPGREVVFTAHLATVPRSLALEGRGLAFLPAMGREELGEAGPGAFYCVTALIRLPAASR